MIIIIIIIIIITIILYSVTQVSRNKDTDIHYAPLYRFSRNTGYPNMLIEPKASMPNSQGLPK
jgi:hypothetical protein